MNVEALFVERPSAEELFEAVEEYFDVEAGTVSPTEMLASATRETRVVAAVVLGEVRYAETDRAGYDALEVGDALGVTNGMREPLDWNYYAVLRSLEQDGLVVRRDGGEYTVAASRFEEVKEQLS